MSSLPVSETVHHNLWTDGRTTTEQDVSYDVDIAYTCGYIEYVGGDKSTGELQLSAFRGTYDEAVERGSWYGGDAKCSVYRVHTAKLVTRVEAQ